MPSSYLKLNLWVDPKSLGKLVHLHDRLQQHAISLAHGEKTILWWSDANNCREHVLSDALETCQNLLKTYYLEHFAQAVLQAETWQDVEAALFALR